MTALFPVFFREFWSADARATQGLSLATIVTQIAVLVCVPLIGSLGDSRRISAPLCVSFAIFGSLATGFLFFVPKGGEVLALSLFVLASVAYFVSIALYDGLLSHVSDPKESDRVSIFGYGFGYLGGGIALLLSILVLKSDPSLFPFVFLGVGIWWALFSIPLWRVKQRKVEKKVSLKETILFLAKQKRIVLFLLGYWLYIDAINTIIRFAVDFGVSIDLPKESVLTALLLTQFVGFPAAYVALKISETLGAVKTILLGLLVYTLMSTSAFFLEHVWQFYALALGIGCVQGGVQALSRSTYSNMIPPEESGVAFALFNVVGRLGCFIGPIILFASAEYTGSSRLGVLSLGALFIAGGLLLWRSQREARFP